MCNNVDGFDGGRLLRVDITIITIVIMIGQTCRKHGIKKYRVFTSYLNNTFGNVRPLLVNKAIFKNLITHNRQNRWPATQKKNILIGSCEIFLLLKMSNFYVLLEMKV